MLRVLLKTAQRGHVELQARGDCDAELEPGDSDRSKDVAVGKREHAAAGSLTQADEPERAGIDLSGGLPTGTSVFEQLPAWLPFVNVRGCDPFVLAVIEFAEQWRHRRIRETGDLGRAPGPLKGAGEHSIEGQSSEPRTEGAGVRFALGREGKIGDSCVLAGEAPLRLAVPSEVDVERQAGLPIISGLPERNERLALSMTAPARTR